MAVWSVEYSTGTYGIGSGETKYGYVKLKLIFDSDGNGNHKVNYELRYQKNTYNQMTIGEVRIIFGSTEVFYRSPSSAQMYSDGDLICSGKFEYSSTGNVQIRFQAGLYEHAINQTGLTTLSLAIDPTLVTAAVTGNAVVGEEVTIRCQNYTWLTNPTTGVSTDQTSATLRYKVGNLEGTIVEKYEDQFFDWYVPTLFYTYYPDVTTTSAILYCDTYDFTGSNLLGTTQYNFTLYFVDGPDMEPTVKDVDPVTVALTGADNTFIRFFSDVEYAFNATPGEGTYLESASITCGNKSTKFSYDDLKEGQTGVIEDIEEATFKFSVTDGRRYTREKTLTRTLIPYVKLTCNIWRIEATGDGTIKVGIGGDIWSDNFGAVRNTLRISYRVKEGNGEFGEWQSIDYLNDDATYEVTVTLDNLDYTKTYTFEAMAEDKLMTVVSRQLPVRAIPVYDWGRDDFNVNVPFNMNHKTVLRHNDLANNVVLSASGGFIYFRPKGTDDNTVEVKISPQGNIELSGDILIEGKSLKSLLGL